MQLALEEAARARAAGEVPLGAVVVCDGEVVGRGHNAVVSSLDPTAHAEVVALRDAATRLSNYRLKGSTLYCTVEPCLMCVGTALHARVARIVFGAADPKVGAIGKLEALREAGAGFNHRFEISGGVLGREAASLIVEFFRERRASGRMAVPSPGMPEACGEVPKWS